LPRDYRSRSTLDCVPSYFPLLIKSFLCKPGPALPPRWSDSCCGVTTDLWFFFGSFPFYAPFPSPARSAHSPCFLTFGWSACLLAWGLGDPRSNSPHNFSFFLAMPHHVFQSSMFFYAFCISRKFFSTMVLGLIQRLPSVTYS